MAMQQQVDVARRMQRVRDDMKRWGVTNAFLAAQLGVSRQYVWQALHGRTPLSSARAEEIARHVDRIITGRAHMRSFGEQLRAARVASGMTLKQVAGLIGYSWVGVQRWERDVCRPKPGVLWHLFSLYGDSSRSMRPGTPPLAANAE